MGCVACGSEIADYAAFCPHCGAQQPFAPSYDEYEYVAFISYRHVDRDTDLAKRIQSAIEAYRLPRGVNSPAASRKLGRVFRDQDELPASGELPTRISNALRRSRTLIVVCSPKTPESAWVNREVIEFATYHVRERIFLALADGASKEGIPPALSHILAKDADGSFGLRATSHVAADFRPATNLPFRQEALRLIAGIVGCGFDDLRQRERVRKIRRVAGIVAAFAIAATATGFYTHAKNAQIEASQVETRLEQSRHAAADADVLLASGDRYGALDAILATVSDDPDALTPEAQRALEQAVGAYPQSDMWWSPCYTLEHKRPIVSWTVNPEYTWFATIDDRAEINIYDAATGALRATCDLPGDTPFEQTPELLRLAAWGDVLYCMGTGHPGVFACFDTTSGHLVWNVENVATFGQTVSADGKSLGFVGLDGEDLNVGVVDTASSHGIGTKTLPNPGLDDPSATISANHASGTEPVLMGFGTLASDVFVAAGDTVAYIDMAADDDTCMHAAALAHPNASSLTVAGDICFVTSYDADALARSLATPYAIQAFDTDMNLLWQFDGESSGRTVGTSGDTALDYGIPRAYGIANLGEGALVAGAGTSLVAIDRTDGSVLYTTDFEAPIVQVDFIWSDQEPIVGALLITLADGKTLIRQPLAPEGFDSIMDLDSGLRLDSAGNGLSYVGGTRTPFLHIGRSADNPSLISVWRTDLQWNVLERTPCADDAQTVAAEALQLTQDAALDTMPDRARIAVESPDGIGVFAQDESGCCMLLDPQGNAVATCEETLPSLHTARFSSDATRVFASTYNPDADSSDDFPTLYVLRIEDGRLTVESEIYCGIAVSADETEIYAEDALGVFTMPYYSRSQLVELAYSILAQTK